MPTTKRCLTPSASNDTIGGIPHLHYFDYLSRGRGQVVRLLWEDAGIAYDDTRYTFAEFPEYKKGLIAEMNPTTNIPVVDLDGRILTQSYPMLRHFARILGKYEGETEEEKYWADSICDIVIDWRTLFVRAFFAPNKEETCSKHEQTDRKRLLQAMEKHLTTNEFSRTGPYVCGEDVTYADFVLYQICHDENLVQNGRPGLMEYPRLRQFVDAVEARPNIKAFLESDRYMG